MVSSAYGFFNGKELSPLVEISRELRLMTGNIGPELPYSIAAGLQIEDPYSAILGLDDLILLLVELEYRGGIFLQLDKDFRISQVGWGYYPDCFAVYKELAKCTVLQILEFCLGISHKWKLLSDCVSLAVLISKSPFPVDTGVAGQYHLQAPRNAENHLWRNYLGSSEAVLHSSYGSSIKEARRRISRTLHNMVKLDRSIQYRTDYGRYCRFLLNDDLYRSLLDKSWESSSSKGSSVPQSDPVLSVSPQ